MARASRAGWATPYLFLTPYLLLLGTFMIAPIGYGIWISLHEWDHLMPNKPWVGLGNYAELFDSESYLFGDFWKSMRATRPNSTTSARTNGTERSRADLPRRAGVDRRLRRGGRR